MHDYAPLLHACMSRHTRKAFRKANNQGASVHATHDARWCRHGCTPGAKTGIALGLGLPEGYFEAPLGGGTSAETSYWVARCIHYPPLAQARAPFQDAATPPPCAVPAVCSNCVRPAST